MSELTTVGNLLVNDALPQDMRRSTHALDKDSIHKLFTEIADKHPAEYKNVLHGLSEVGRNVAWTEGSSISLAALAKSPAKERLMAPVRAQLKTILDDDTIDDKTRNGRVIDLMLHTAKPLQDAIFEESKAEGSPFVDQIASGARGKKGNLTSLRGADLLTTGTKNELIPIPLLNSYAEGLTPAQYFASTYGQRKGEVDTKLATADAGYLIKKIVGAAHRQVVTKDAPDPSRLPIGLPVKTSDRDNVGAILAMDAGPFKAGTRVTDDVLETLQDKDIDELVIHSPLTELSSDGGLSKLAVGYRTRPGLAQIGDNAGIPAAQAIGERLAQGVLSSKHTQGVRTRINRGGMEYLNRLFEAPEHFEEAGPLAEADGQVEDVRKAPQGGHYITVGGKEHYAGPKLEPTVKRGDTVELGDDLTDGTPHPEQLVRLRGMGEARRVYTGMVKDALHESGVDVNRRNVENVVAGLLNWGRVTNPEGLGDNVYDDIVPWNMAVHAYKPRATAQLAPADKQVGKYLDEPALHYTPGTKITNRVATTLKKHGIGDVYGHPEPMDLEPEMVRSVMSVAHDPDWRTRLSGFYTASSFERALHRGLESDTNSTSYVPSLTASPATFGRQLGTTGKYGQSD